MNPLAILALLAVALFAFGRKKDGNETTDQPPPGTGGGNLVPQVEQPTEGMIRAALRKIMEVYGVDIARNVERIYRLETADFTSLQFQLCNTPGMVATKPTYSFGWKARGFTPDKFAPVVTLKENATGKPTMFVAIRSFAYAAVYVAQVLKERGNDPGKWMSSAGSASYRAAVAKVVPSYVNSF